MYKPRRKRPVLLAIFIFSISGIFLITSCTASPKGDYPFYADEQALFQKSDLIITGEVVKVNKPTKMNLRLYGKGETAREEDMELVTVSEFRVTDVIKGDISVGDIIKVKQLGDENSWIEESVRDYDGFFQKGKNYVLFLSVFSNPDMPYSTLSPMQGQITIEDGKTKVNKINPLYQSGIPIDQFVAELKTKVNSYK